MFTDPEERQIRELFEEERRREERSTPSFSAVVSARRDRGLGHWRSALGLRTLGVAASVAALLLVSSLVLSTRPEPGVAVSPSVASHLYWESPTELYLSAPGQETLRAVLEASSADQATRSQQ